jgi:hypothetical protein
MPHPGGQPLQFLLYWPNLAVADERSEEIFTKANLSDTFINKYSYYIEIVFKRVKILF